MTVQVRLIPLRNRHWSFSGKDPAPVMRQRGFESHPVLSVFDNSGDGDRAHDVAVAYRLAMADVRVRLLLGTLGNRLDNG